MSEAGEGNAGAAQPEGAAGSNPPAAEHAHARAPIETVVPRWIQLALLPIALLAAWVVIKAAGRVVMIFIVAAIIALLLNPLGNALQRAHVRRGLAVLAVYLGFFIALAALGYLLAHPIAKQAERFARNVPHITTEANTQLAHFQRELNENGVHIHILEQGKTALQTLESKLAKSSKKIAEFGAAFLKEGAGAIFDVIIVFVLSVYMLLYGQRIGALVRSVMPGGHDPRTDDYPRLVQRAVSRYVGGQLLFSVIMGVTAGLGLYIYGVLGIFPDGSKFALAFGVVYGFFELIPYIGPILGAILPVAVALFTGGPLTALWVVLLFIGLQQLEGHIVAPQIFGRTLRINPLLVIFALLFGLQVRGVIGALVALPVLAILRETVIYLRTHLVLERWSKAPDPLL
jgi:predicted PurR-regulated permease PerM